jgi:hypothetical protein
MMKKLVLAALLSFVPSCLFAASIVVNPVFHVDDDDGNPLAGGCVYSYNCGGSTKHATCANATCSSDNENPIELDSRGEADIYTDQCIKIRVYTADADGVCDANPTTTLVDEKDLLYGIGGIPPADGISLSATYGNDIAAAITAIGATPTTLVCDDTATIADGTTVTLDSGTTWESRPGCLVQGVAGGGTETFVVSKIKDPGDVAWIGADLTVSGLKKTKPEWWGVDGSDDDVQIQAAINAAGANGEVVLSNTTYNTTARVDLLSGQHLYGSSEYGTIIDAVGVTALYSPESATGVLIENMSLAGDGTASTYGVHIYKNPEKSTIRNINISGFGTAGTGGGVYWEGVAGNTWGAYAENCRVESSGRGFVAENSQALTLINCSTKYCTGPTYFHDVTGLSIIGGEYEYTSELAGEGWNLYLDTVAEGFINSYSEGATDGHIRIKDSSGVTVTNSKISGYSGTTMAYGWVYLENSYSCKIVNNYIGHLDANFTGKADIYIDATSDNNTIEGNIIEPDGGIAGNYHVINLGKNNVFINNRGSQNAGANVGPITVLWDSSVVYISGIATSLLETFVDGDTSPDVGSQMVAYFRTGNTAPTAITNFDHAGSGGLDIHGQEIILAFTDNNTTLNHNVTKILLKDGIDWTPTIGDTWRGIRFGTITYETSRSDNTP